MTRDAVAAIVIVLAVAGAVMTFLVMSWVTNRASRTGLYGAMMGSWLGVETRPGDPPRPVGLAGEGAVGAVGLALTADAVTNPVAWLRWLRDMVHAEQDGADPPSPPSVGFA